jgi:hypothetical protein
MDTTERTMELTVSAGDHSELERVTVIKDGEADKSIAIDVFVNGDVVACEDDFRGLDGLSVAGVTYSVLKRSCSLNFSPS